MSNMGGGDWGNDLTSESLMPVSALCAESKINNLILKITATPEGGKLLGILQPIWTKVVESDMRLKWLGEMLQKELVVRDIQHFGENIRL